MKKQTASWTTSKKATTTRWRSSTDALTTPEIEHMRDCEAQEWKARYRMKVTEVGSVNARSWWQQVCDDIARIRGQAALEDLRRRMNKGSHE